ncbi:MAG: hypothetical protein JNK77_19640 [Saprospiraceae bacterium]|nr:hypothetical protein [Saprospiraceae bacterium]
MKNRYAICLLALLCYIPLSAQKVLQIERYGRAKTTKIHLGEELTYRLKGDNVWHTRAMEDLNIEEGLIVMPDRYVKIADIEALRYSRGWPRAVGRQLFWLGAGWSLYGLIGNLADGDPDTNYRLGDAAVTGTAWGLSWLVPRVFKYKKIKMGERRRLRAVDINFYPVN